MSNPKIHLPVPSNYEDQHSILIPKDSVTLRQYLWNRRKPVRYPEHKKNNIINKENGEGRMSYAVTSLDLDSTGIILFAVLYIHIIFYL